MNAFTGQGVQVRSGGCGQRFTFTGFHLRHTTFVQNHGAHQLHVEHPKVQRPLARFSRRSKSLNQQVIQRFALGQSCFECSGLVLERAIAQRLVLSLKGIDGLNLRLKAAQVLGISIAEDSFCEALKHDVCRPKEMFTCLTGCR